MSDEIEPLSGSEPPEPIKRVRADALSRANRAWRARVLGASWEQAAEIAGYANGPNAQRAVRAVYDRLPAVDREEQRRLWRDTLEVARRQGVTDVLEQRGGAVTALVRVAQAAARLDGLDAPVEVDLYSPSQNEIEQFVAKVLAHAHPELEEGDIFEAEVVSDEPEKDDP